MKNQTPLNITRKEFLEKAFGITILGSVVSCMGSCSKNDSSTSPASKEQIDISLPAYSALNNIGGSISTSQYLIVNTGNGYIAVLKYCPHEQGLLEYKQLSKQFHCLKHTNQYYTIDGTGGRQEWNGNLAIVNVVKNGNILTIG